MQRILVIRGGAIGDMIVTLPALRALRLAFPRATIELLGNPSRAILAQHPHYVDRITDLERWELYRFFNQSPTVSEALATFLSTCELILSYLPVPDEIFPTNLRHYCQGIWLKDGQPSLYRHVDRFYTRLVNRAERRSAQTARTA